MATQTGQCPSCRAINAYTATNCLECNAPLPWANAIASAQQQIQAAQATAAQAQAALAQQQHAAAGYYQPRQPPAPPTIPVNIYETFAGCFIGNWSSALEGCKADGALKIGIACAFIYNVCIVAGAYMAVRKLQDFFASALGIPTALPTNSLPSDSLTTNSLPTPTPGPTSSGLTADQFFKLLIVAAIPLLSIAISSALARKLFSDDEEGSFANDIFVAGVSLLPAGFFAVLTGWLGIGNVEVLVVAAVFTLSYTILLLYNGCTIVSRIKDTAAAISVPLILLLSAWITKVVLTQLTNS